MQAQTSAVAVTAAAAAVIATAAVYLAPVSLGDANPASFYHQPHPEGEESRLGKGESYRP